MKPDFKAGDQVLVSTLSFKNLKGPKKMKDSFQYFQTEEDKLPSRKRNCPPPDILGVQDFPGPVRKIIMGRKIRLNGKDQRQYLVRFKDQTADKNIWLAEDAISDGNLHPRRLGASMRTEQSHQ
ncbi:hypothetical protein O181_018751 [Austropuccinia psidii MF-1]|uniref:Chromo domain-containing protein n=1 Tax=Austropuccinia psidii MF-1 TaxID=1389203 RepID=A0A9Q3GT81_9BASI|nr:hypothetical protein [Austropuccinia psidii MF-1]